MARIHRTKQKGLKDPDNQYDTVIHLEPDTLECEVKWALGSITMNKVSEGDGISAELFQVLKDDAVESVVLNMPANLENSAVVPELVNFSFQYSFQSQRKTMQKNVQTMIQLCSFYMLAR